MALLCSCCRSLALAALLWPPERQSKSQCGDGKFSPQVTKASSGRSPGALMGRLGSARLCSAGARGGANSNWRAERAQVGIRGASFAKFAWATSRSLSRVHIVSLLFCSSQLSTLNSNLLYLPAKVAPIPAARRVLRLRARAVGRLGRAQAVCKRAPPGRLLEPPYPVAESLRPECEKVPICLELVDEAVEPVE